MFVKPISFSRKWLVPVLLGSALLLAACGGSGTPTPGGGPTGTGLCSSDFFPIVVGASWTYASTSSAGDTTWTSTISDVSDSNFTMTNQFSDLTTTQQWSCTAEGLAALQYGAGPEATLTATGVQGTFETTDTSGVTFPAHLTVGDTWTQTFTIHGDMTITEGQTASADGTVTQTYTATGMESVDVPAGTFNAMKVDANLHFDLTLNMNGLEVPFAFDSVTTNWWAQGVGWVKSNSSVSLSGESIDSVTELQSFSIP